MIHEMKLKEIYFDKVKCGEKIYEIRLNDEKRKMISVGDFVIFKKEPELKEVISTIVKDLTYFESFDEMIDVLPVNKIGFIDVEKSVIADIYHQFYSREDEQKYGVVAIKVELVK